MRFLANLPTVFFIALAGCAEEGTPSRHGGGGESGDVLEGMTLKPAVREAAGIPPRITVDHHHERYPYWVDCTRAAATDVLHSTEGDVLVVRHPMVFVGRSPPAPAEGTKVQVVGVPSIRGSGAMTAWQKGQCVALTSTYGDWILAEIGAQQKLYLLLLMPGVDEVIELQIWCKETIADTVGISMIAIDWLTFRKGEERYILRPVSDNAGAAHPDIIVAFSDGHGRERRKAVWKYDEELDFYRDREAGSSPKLQAPFDFPQPAYLHSDDPRDSERGETVSD